MKRFLAFMSNTNKVDNTASKVSKLGELSTFSRTFSKDIKTIGSANYQDLDLLVFSNTDDNDNEIPSDASLHTLVFAIFSRANNFIASLTPGSTVDINALKTFILQVSNVDQLDIGPILQNDDSTYRSPSFIKFKTIGNNPIEVSLWHSDEAIRNQYPIVSLEVIPNVADIKTLRDTHDNVVNVVNSADIESDTFKRVEQARNKHPETDIRPYKFKIHGLDKPNDPIDVVWWVLSYGPHNNHENLIKKALTDYIKAHDGDHESDWKNIIAPDLYLLTEFYIFPRWDIMSVPNQSDQAGIFNPIINVKEEIANAKLALTAFTPSYIDDQIEILPFYYKGLSLTSVPGEGNKTNDRSLLTLFSDYLVASPTNNNFLRMKLKTQNFVKFLNDLIITAESRYVRPNIQTDIRSVTRGNKDYYIGTYENIEYLIKSKDS